MDARMTQREEEHEKAKLSRNDKDIGRPQPMLKDPAANPMDDAEKV